MKLRISFSVLIIFLFICNATVCQDKTDYTGYLGSASISLFSTATEWRALFAPDGSISETARKKIFDDLTVIYGSEDNPVDSADLVKKIKTENLPLAGVLYQDDFRNIAGLYGTRGGTGILINILTDVVIGKTSMAAKSVLFKILLNSLFTNPEMNILFPNTSSFLKTFEESKITTSPRLFAETFKIDFKKLPFNTSEIFDKVDKYQNILKDRPYLRIYTEAYKYYQALKNIKPIFKTNHNTLENLRDLKGYHSELYNSLKLMQYVVFQLNTDNYSSISGESSLVKNIEYLEEDRILQDLYFGLICAQNPPVEFADNSLKDNNLKSGAVDLSEVRIYSTKQMINIMSKNGKQDNLMNYLSTYGKKYSNIAMIKDTIEAFIYYEEPVPEELKEAYFDESVDFLEYVLNPNNLYPDGKFDKSEINLFIDIIKKYKKLENNIEQNQNFAALMNSFYIYSELCKSDSTFGEYFNVFSGDYLKAISIIADLTSANTDEEMARILDNYVFSSFSTDMKKESDFNLILNSYAGLYYGEEADIVKDNWTRNRGLTAPIGLELSKGFKNWGNLSLFVPILDIGAIVDFELNNDSTETTTNFKIENIFSPGAYLIYGLPSIPVSFGGGFQFSPQLGKITLEGAEIGPRKLRWNVFLAFDMPFLKILSF
ncbi:MAG: hypothetical protein JW917_00825 [Ignavibacteria bacterium]|nr:hypothetical protein [Ignavibacteria bacterium]